MTQFCKILFIYSSPVLVIISGASLYLHVSLIPLKWWAFVAIFFFKKKEKKEKNANIGYLKKNYKQKKKNKQTNSNKLVKRRYKINYVLNSKT